MAALSRLLGLEGGARDFFRAAGGNLPEDFDQLDHSVLEEMEFKSGGSGTLDLGKNGSQGSRVEADDMETRVRVLFDQVGGLETVLGELQIFLEAPGKESDFGFQGDFVQVVDDQVHGYW